MKIDSFEGEYRFLSNFFMSPVEMDGKTFDSVEHAYQAAKSDDAEYRANFFFGITPGQAKKLGRTANLRADWEQVKIGIMTDLVRKKFNDKELASKLLATGDAELIEGNWTRLLQK